MRNIAENFEQKSPIFFGVKESISTIECKTAGMAVKSPLRYPGGKSRAVKQILKLIPGSVDAICSPFVGGGSIELACASRGVKVYAYDAFEPLVNFWQFLLNDALTLADIVKSYYPLDRSEFYSLQKRYFDLKDKMEMAAVFFVLNRASFSGTTFSGGMSPGHKRFTENTIKQLRSFRIDNFSVNYADFKDTMKKHNNDFMYLDPPYLINQKLYGNKGNMHDGFDHKGLADILNRREGWILSYNDCKAIRDLYEGNKFLLPEWAYGMNSTKQSKEIIILSKDFI